MIPYADTNFVVRLYLDLAGTDQAVQLVQQRDPANRVILPVGWLHRIEMVNALQLYVFLARQGRTPRVTLEKAQAAQASFQSDLRSAVFMSPASVPISDLEAQCEEISLRYVARHGFRTYDALHVASALLLNCDTFWSFDQKANKLATLEGLKVLKLPST